MSDPAAWLDGVGAKLVAGVALEQRLEFSGRLADLMIQAGGLSPAELMQARNGFVSACLGRGLGAALPADPLDAGEYLGGLQDAVGAAQEALQKPLAILAEVEAAAGQLREAADVAWRVARTASGTVRALEKAEIAAAKVAMLTGLPPVTAAWALATQLRGAALVVGELAAKAGRAADHAWGSVVRVLDDMREAVFDRIDGLERIVDSTLDAVTAGVETAAEVVHADLFGDLEQAFATIA